MVDAQDVWLCPDLVFDGTKLLRRRAIRFQGAYATDMRNVAEIPAGAANSALQGIVTAGFLDLQVNGGGDVLLNTTPTADGMSAIAAAHRRFGTVGIMPTVITDTPEVLAKVAQAAIVANGREGILGLHIEGPHIAIARRGTHSQDCVRPMDDATISIVKTLLQAQIAVIVTLAPEAATSAQIAELVTIGAVVSLGHTDATAAETRSAISAGAKCFTHLFNAMSPMLSRLPGVTGAAINSDCYVGIICDGIHVADEMVALAIRARPKRNTMFLVSDAMPTVGGQGHFLLYGQKVQLHGEKLLNVEGSLAGAHTTMAQSVARLVNVVGIDREIALQMAVTVPANVIGKPQLAKIVGRSATDLLVLDRSFAVIGTCADFWQ